MTINYIQEYYQALDRGKKKAGKKVFLFYEKVLDDLKNKRYFFNEKKANRAIKFIELFCHHHEGKLAPNTIELELWQKALLSVLFGCVDADGMRQYREAIIIMGRKNGKTLFASAIAEYMAYADGEYGARIYFVAPKLQQAEFCYNAFYQSLTKESELNDISKKRRTDIYIEKSNTSIQPLAFSAKKSDGLNPSLTICDEISSWSGEGGLKQYEVLKSALGARKQPLLISISTAGYENDSIYDELIKRATAVLNGTSKEKRLACFLYMIDDVEKWNDIQELYKANPNLGVSVSEEYLKEEIAVAEQSLSKKAEFLTKYCNIKQNSSVAWLDAITIDKSFTTVNELEAFRNTYAVGGIDLSRTTDLTACTLLIERDSKIFVFAKFFLPRNKLEEATARDGVPYSIYVQKGWLTLSGDNFVDYHDCFNWFRDLVEQYQIYPLKVGYDRYTAQYLVQDMKEYGFHMDDVNQGENLTPVIREVEGKMKDNTFECGDNNLLKMHFLDSAIKRNDLNDRVRLVKISQNAHIDGMASFLCAMCVRQKWYGEIGVQLRNEG